jgi:glycosyltransferase involved in cell wall biosynthesis
MKSIKFSIIIPTYNEENDIIKTLDTIFIQTYKNFEVILIYDDVNKLDLKFINNASDNKIPELGRHVVKSVQ